MNWLKRLFRRKSKRTEADLAMVEIDQSQRSPLSILFERVGVAQENKYCRGGNGNERMSTNMCLFDEFMMRDNPYDLSRKGLHRGDVPRLK